MPFRIEDKTLSLPDGRTLAYADSGNTSSNVVVLFLHGAFGVGDASRPPQSLLDKHYHFVAPSLPGWGKSSPLPSPSDFCKTMTTDMTTLLKHLHPNHAKLKLFICGHSFGTVAAQILYGAPYEQFPLGRHIVGLMLLSPHSPPHCHPEYSATMSWRNYFMTGPPAKFFPVLPSLMKYTTFKKLSSEKWIEKHFIPSLYPLKTEEQRDLYSQWREAYEVEDGKLQKEAAAAVSLSVAHTWRGFTDIPAIYHSGWGGIRPNDLDAEHSKPPVLIASCKDDIGVPLASAEWLTTAYKHSKFVLLEGGNMSAFFQLDRLWDELLSMESS